LNFKQLEAFVRVAEMQSFTRAAKQMFMSQPAISFQIKALEDHLQVSLFRQLSSYWAIQSLMYLIGILKGVWQIHYLPVWKQSAQL